MIGALVAAAIAVVAVVALVNRPGDTPDPDREAPGALADGPVDGPPDAALPDVDHAALVAAVHSAELGTIAPVRLAPGLVPPTNRWFSGLVFGEEPQPVFPRPLSVGLTGTGFALGLAEPVNSEKAIVASHVAAVTVDAGAADAQVSAYDDASVTVDLLDAGGEPIGTLVIAQGSPFASLTAARDLDLTTDAAFEAAEPPGGGDGGYGTAESEGRTWAVVAPEGALDGAALRLTAGESATWYALPDEAGAETEEVLARAAGSPVTGTESSYGVGDGIARTTLGYRTVDGEPTAYVTMPHHRNGDQPERPDCGLGTYPSV